MIWLFLFFLFFFFKLKNFFFFNSFLELESSSLFMATITPLVLILIFSLLNSLFIKSEENNFFLLFFFVVMFVTLCFFMSNPFFFLFSLEMCVFPMVSLIFIFSKGFDKIVSVFFMFFINILGSIPFMIFFTTQFFNFYNGFNCLNLNLLESKNYLAFFLFLLVLICKIPMFIFHFWLTKAHVSASGSCSMVLASLMLKLGTFGLFKFSNFFLNLSSSMLVTFFSLSIWGSFIVMLSMVRFFDMKYLIACSSITHMAMILPLICMNMSVSIYSSVFMMVGHGLVSFILFYLISILYELSLNRSFELNKSTESSSKILSMWIFIFFFLNLGIPPFLNFFSEFFAFLSFMKFSLFSCFFLFFLMMIPIMFCMQMIVKMIFGKKSSLLFYSLGIINSYNFMFILMLMLIPFLYY